MPDGIVTALIAGGFAILGSVVAFGGTILVGKLSAAQATRQLQLDAASGFLEQATGALDRQLRYWQRPEVLSQMRDDYPDVRLEVERARVRAARLAIVAPLLTASANGLLEVLMMIETDLYMGDMDPEFKGRTFEEYERQFAAARARFAEQASTVLGFASSSAK